MYKTAQAQYWLGPWLGSTIGWKEHTIYGGDKLTPMETVLSTKCKVYTSSSYQS